MSGPAHDLDESTRRTIEAFLDDHLVDSNVPGGRRQPLRRRGVGWTTALGARTRDPVAPATPDSLFHAASVTKAFTAIACLQFW